MMRIGSSPRLQILGAWCTGERLDGLRWRLVGGPARQDAVQPFLPSVCDKVMDDAAIWRKYKDELVRYATVLVGPAHAEDVLSAVVERILRNRGSLSELDDARPYLFKAVLNEGRNHLRRSSRPRGAWAADLVEMPPEVRPDVVTAVARLPERQRAAVYLTYWRDLPIAEVAALMGCRAGTVKRYLHLARTRLEERLER